MIYLLRASLVALCLVLVGCSIAGDDYVRPGTPADKMEKWNGREGTISGKKLDSKALAKWWTTFGNDTLNDLIEQAVQANLDIRTAKAQLRRARAERNIAKTGLSPQVAIGGTAQRSTGPTGNSELYRASLDASWEIDLFGGIARGIEASEADLQAAEESKRDALITVLAEVALNYNDLVSFERQKEIVNENLKAQEKYLKIVRAQRKAGGAIQLDVDRASSNVESVRSQIPTLNQQISQVKNRLAVILGKTPGALDSELANVKQLTIPSERIAVGIPAEVLRRRPDVRKAERQLAAATARVGVAEADLYPKFALTGSIGIESVSPSGLLTTISPGVQYTLYDGGRIREQIEVQNALQEEALVQYERTILTALEDVQNSITSFAEEQARNRSLEGVVRSARSANKLAESQHRVGETNFLAVLDAQRTLLDSEGQLVQNEAQIVGNLIRLYKSLGGGWQPIADGDSSKGLRDE